MSRAPRTGWQAWQGQLARKNLFPLVSSCLTKYKLGAVGFEPTKAEPADLQSAPFDHFGTRPVVAAASAAAVHTYNIRSTDNHSKDCDYCDCVD